MVGILPIIARAIWTIKKPECLELLSWRGLFLTRSRRYPLYGDNRGLTELTGGTGIGS